MRSEVAAILAAAGVYGKFPILPDAIMQSAIPSHIRYGSGANPSKRQRWKARRKQRGK